MAIPVPDCLAISHMMGGYAGGQAQYVRVPFANVGPLKIESDLPDEKVLFLSDIFPDRIHGCGKCPDSGGRHGRGVGLRTGRTVRDCERVHAGRSASYRDRSYSGASRPGATGRRHHGRLLARKM